MPDFVWPKDLDDARRLLSLVGSFWGETYAGNDLVASLLHAKAQQQAQAQSDLYELTAAFSRFRVPIFHREEWSMLVLRESERNTSQLTKFDGTANFDGTVQFDTPYTSDTHTWLAPSGLVTCPVVSDKITGPTTTYVQDVDFSFEAKNGIISFRDNPFQREDMPIAEVLDSGIIVDRTMTLWIYGGTYDWDTVYRQYGYVLGTVMQSSRPYKELVNAIYDGIIDGTNTRSLSSFMSAVCDVPLAKTTETITQIHRDAEGLWIVSDVNAYHYATQANAIVTVGQVVQEDDALVDALRFYDLNRGEVPSSVVSLALGQGTLSSAFLRELVFENKTVPLQIEENVDGYTKVSFEISGWPSDVEKFWDSVHSDGVAKDDTLAMRLDTRINKSGQPNARYLPATINPLKFLAENIYRGNAFMITVRPEAFGSQSLGLHAARFLRKLVPPQTAYFLLATFGFDEKVTMDSPGSEAEPGYEEEIGFLLGNQIDENILPIDYSTENVRIYQINGYCA